MIEIDLLLLKIPFDRGKNFLFQKKIFKIFVFSIRLKNLKESISGFYTCEASNDYQTLTSTGFVRVKNPSNFFFCFVFASQTFILVDMDRIDLNDDS